MTGSGEFYRAMAPVDDKQTPHVAPREKRATVLLVDDEEMMLRAMHRVLHPDWQVVALADAHEALRRVLSGEVFDAILCDMLMPTMSGIEFYRSIHTADPVLASRIVFMTGGSVTADAFLVGLSNPVLAKPFTRDTLRSAVTSLCPPDLKGR
jgi:CheY-like chemotaxis protein